MMDDIEITHTNDPHTGNVSVFLPPPQQPDVRETMDNIDEVRVAIPGNFYVFLPPPQQPNVWQTMDNIENHIQSIATNMNHRHSPSLWQCKICKTFNERRNMYGPAAFVCDRHSATVHQICNVCDIAEVKLTTFLSRVGTLDCIMSCLHHTSGRVVTFAVPEEEDARLNGHTENFLRFYNQQPMRLPTERPRYQRLYLEVECPVCLEIKDKNAVPLCGHHTCEECIVNMTECGMCRKAF